jgi:pimeloyl-ACP methyl ester carboxylesterase
MPWADRILPRDVCDPKSLVILKPMVTKRGRRWLARGSLLGALALVGTLGGATWALSGRIGSEMLVVPGPVDPVEVISLSGGEVTLPLVGNTAAPGRWGLELEAGYVQLGEVVGSGDDRVVRRVLRVDGDAAAGDTARFDTDAFGGDPAARGIEFREVIIPSAAEDIAAWTVAGEDDTWVVIAHDAGESREQALRVLPTIQRLGLPVIVPSLRTAGASTTDLGEREWRDIEAAADFAFESGAVEVVVMGFGVGGSAALRFATEARLGPGTVGVILDAPLLDPGALVDGILGAENVPGFLIGWAKAAASTRYGIDWEALDHQASALEYSMPILIFHGAEDAEIPAASSEAFVALAPAAELVIVAGAGHGESWNVDPLAYESAISGFLERVAVGPSPSLGDDG